MTGIVLALMLVAAAGTSPSAAADDDARSREIVGKMVAAHGGLAPWRNATSVSFHSSLEVNFGGNNWVAFQEEVTGDPRRRRIYATLPNPDGTSGRIAYDGASAWSAGELRGLARAPARFTAWRNFYLFNLPWMTQDQGVRFGPAGHAELPGIEDECFAIPMSFDDGVGDTPGDTYILYVDTGTFQLRGAEYVMTYRQMMPPGTQASPPSIFVWEETTRVGDLLVPTGYTVYWSKDHSVAVRNGRISHWSFSEPFDEERLIMPANGVPDESTP